MKEHPNIGYNMIRDINHLTKASYIVRSEHEKYDGTGYPNGLKKHNIPVGARIIAVADAYDAMTTYRPYRKALSKKEAIRRLKENAGSQFDPRIVKAFFKAIRRCKPS
jgi:HD-GYP domain-containing protein (c-di-GMP phosphodiesterase class II)